MPWETIQSAWKNEQHTTVVVIRPLAELNEWIMTTFRTSFRAAGKVKAKYIATDLEVLQMWLGNPGNYVPVSAKVNFMQAYYLVPSEPAVVSPPDEGIVLEQQRKPGPLGSYVRLYLLPYISRVWSPSVIRGAFFSFAYIILKKFIRCMLLSVTEGTSIPNHPEIGNCSK